MKLISWNVNGLRAALRAGMADFMAREQPDTLCLQEIKATPEDVEASVFDGYHVTWNPAAKKGYAGVLIATRQTPLTVTHGLGLPAHDTEGRVLLAEFPDLQVVTVYTPNSQRGLTRLDYRLQWDAAFQKWLQNLDKKKPVVVCGDFNCAHEEIDLANPRENRRNAGFTEEERSGFSALLDAGFMDSFRALHPGEPGHYSWWTYRSDARTRNIGWRLDYWLVSQKLWPRVRHAKILSDVMGSDHCPVVLELE
jgi:exodeoxyribonuclease-3